MCALAFYDPCCNQPGSTDLAKFKDYVVPITHAIGNLCLDGDFAER